MLKEIIEELVGTLETLVLGKDSIDYSKAAFTIGRFQPLTLGHMKMIDELKKFNKAYIFIVKGKKSSKDKDKNPFDFELQKEMIQKVAPKIEVIEIPSGYFVDEIEKLPENEFYLLCGSDRVKAYQRMLDYLENKKVEIIEVPRSDDDISATKVRQALKDNNKKEFEKMTPKEIHNYYDNLKKYL